MADTTEKYTNGHAGPDPDLKAQAPTDDLEEVCVSNGNSQSSAPASEDEDLSEVMVDQSYSKDQATAGLGLIDIGRPRKFAWFRIHPDDEYHQWVVCLHQTEEDKEFFIVDKTIAEDPHIKDDAIMKCRMYFGVTSDGGYFFLPVAEPDENGNRNKWHRSRLLIIELAKPDWIQARARKRISAYQPYYPDVETKANLGEPVWPTKPLRELIKLAIFGKRIQSLDHPVLRTIMKVVPGKANPEK